MPTRILLWNPKRYDWKDYEEIYKSYLKNGFVIRRWSCGNQFAKAGERVFLFKVGLENPKGFIGSGVAITDFYVAPRFDDPKRTSNYIDVKFDVLLDYKKENIFLKEWLIEKWPRRGNWAIYQSGTTIYDEHEAEMWKEWNEFVKASRG